MRCRPHLYVGYIVKDWGYETAEAVVASYPNADACITVILASL
jgi:hypothetical protein